ncbi:hypothetical protein PTD2_12744 [Pseudoalteromonas tunicata D2]|uniref:Uncharacterized protein n=1 Tax=Pseudoalteromonas tunicata D2 TaxID=87626 RepID=A4C6T3_9GAMM|nr:hypothetical protein PTD2_12744 [Pseudoalteromonas tunicata D2]
MNVVYFKLNENAPSHLTKCSTFCNQNIKQIVAIKTQAPN